MIVTVSMGPNRIAKMGAMSIPEPTPMNPRISPAKAVTAKAISELVVNMASMI